MPELPEVETVKEGLVALGVPGQVIEEVVYYRDNLRNALPVALHECIPGAKIDSIKRRAKYLLFETSVGTIISHLGMTGTWRKEKHESLKKHDHIAIRFSDFYLIYNDPRRFGFFDFLPLGEEKNIYLDHLGPEPLSETFNPDYLFAITKKREAPIKNVIMDQKVVVGVGNIYACEALFRSKIKPQKMSRRVSKAKLQELVSNIKDVLGEAIAAGGSTINDFKQAGGDSGYFQHQFDVYGREGEACNSCNDLIKNIKLGGRSSFYCSSCQKS